MKAINRRIDIYDLAPFQKRLFSSNNPEGMVKGNALYTYLLVSSKVSHVFYAGFRTKECYYTFINCFDNQFSLLTTKSLIIGSARAMIFLTTCFSFVFTSKFYRYIINRVAPASLPLFIFDILKKISCPVIILPKTGFSGIEGEICSNVKGGIHTHVSDTLLNFSMWAEVLWHTNSFKILSSRKGDDFILDSKLQDQLTHLSERFNSNEELFKLFEYEVAQLNVFTRNDVPFVTFSSERAHSNKLGFHRYRNYSRDGIYLTSSDLGVALNNEFTALSHLIFLKAFDPRFVLSIIPYDTSVEAGMSISDIILDLTDATFQQVFSAWLALSVQPKKHPKSKDNGDDNVTAHGNSGIGNFDTSLGDYYNIVNESLNAKRVFSSNYSDNLGLVDVSVLGTSSFGSIRRFRRSGNSPTSNVSVGQSTRPGFVYFNDWGCITTFDGYDENIAVPVHHFGLNNFVKLFSP